MVIFSHQRCDIMRSSLSLGILHVQTNACNWHNGRVCINYKKNVHRSWFFPLLLYYTIKVQCSMDDPSCFTPVAI